jgi:tetratricopeptide (TPR) repeat protein
VGLRAFWEKWSELEATLAASEKNVPDNLVCYYRAANTLLNIGKELTRAEGYFRKYLTQEPEPNAASHAATHWRLGLVLEKQGRKADAMAELQTALKMDPNSPAKADLKRLK